MNRMGPPSTPNSYIEVQPPLCCCGDGTSRVSLNKGHESRGRDPRERVRSSFICACVLREGRPRTQAAVAGCKPG